MPSLHALFPTTSSRSCNLRRLSRRSVLELGLAKLIITMLLGLLVAFLVVLVSVALESVHSRSASTSVRRRTEAYRCVPLSSVWPVYVHRSANTDTQEILCVLKSNGHLTAR